MLKLIYGGIDRHTAIRTIPNPLNQLEAFLPFYSQLMIKKEIVFWKLNIS